MTLASIFYTKSICIKSWVYIIGSLCVILEMRVECLKLEFEPEGLFEAWLILDMVLRWERKTAERDYHGSDLKYAQKRVSTTKG